MRPWEPPAQRALAELNRVSSLGLPEKGRYAEHYALLSQTLRAYVRDRFPDTIAFGVLSRIPIAHDRMQPPDWTDPATRLQEWP